LLPDSREAKQRRAARAKLKKELQQNKGRGTLVYEKDNVKIVQHVAGIIPEKTEKEIDPDETAKGAAREETTASADVYTYFDIVITNQIEEKDTFYVKAEFETESFSPGDTVNVIMKKLDKKGIEYEFDPSTNFEVGIEFGCKAVYILDKNGEKQDYVSSINGPIRLIVAEDITDEFDIELRVGAHDDAVNIYKPYSDFLLLLSHGPNTVNMKPFNDEVLSPEDPGYCIPPNYVRYGYGVAEGKVEQDCNEPIEECSDLEPQILDDSVFKEVSSGLAWYWFDKDGNYRWLIVDDDYCKKNTTVINGVTRYRVGITKVKTFMHDIDSVKNAYFPLEDMKLNICLDTRDNNPLNHKWKVNVDNLRIPIYVENCVNVYSENYPFFVDLGDGNFKHLLELGISNCADYDNAMRTLDYLILGPYSNPDKENSITLESLKKYYFELGVLTHEGHHFQNLKEEISEELNDVVFPKINSYNLLMSDYPCPEDIKKKKMRDIHSELTTGIRNGSDLKLRMGYEDIELDDGKIISVPKSEIEADLAASKVYREIKKRIKTWASSKEWFINSDSCRTSN
jgi:hypothetical protein